MKRSDFFQRGVSGEIPPRRRTHSSYSSSSSRCYNCWCLTDLRGAAPRIGCCWWFPSFSWNPCFDWWVRVGHKGELELVHGHMDKKKGFQPPSLSKYQPEKAKKMWNAYTANCKQWCWDPLRHWQAAMNPWRPPEGSHEIPIFHSCWFNETLNRVDADSWFGCVCVRVFHSRSETQVVQEFFSQQYEIFSQQYQYRSKHIVLLLISRWVPQSSDPHPVYAHVMFFSRSLTLSLSLPAHHRNNNKKKKKTSRPTPRPGAKKTKKKISQHDKKQPPSHLNRLLEALIHHQC